MTTSVTQGSEFAKAYPFASHSADLSGLISDLCLSFRPRKAVKAPLRVTWLHGFGTDPVAPPGYAPSPVNAREILIEDGDGDTVFDSTSASFHSTTWGDRLVLQWTGDEDVCRLVASPVTASEWPTNIEPQDGELDARAWHAVPARVNSVGESAGKVELAEGFNLSMIVADTVSTDGGRVTTMITMSASPGAGAGKKPACTGATEGLAVLRINGRGPDDAGNFLLTSDDCYRVQVPLTASGPVADRVTAYGGAGLSGDDASHAIALSNDCTPCCSCGDYLAVYTALKRVWDEWQGIAARLEALRDDYEVNKNRWGEARACVIDGAGRLVLLPEAGGSFQVHGSYCNVSSCCLDPLELRFTVEASLNGSPLGVGQYVISTSSGQYQASSTETLMPNSPAPLADYRVASVTFGGVNARTTALARFRMCVSVPGAAEDDTVTVTVTMTVHAPDSPPCVLPEADSAVAESVVAIWAGTPPATGDATRFQAVRTATRSNEPRPSYECDC